MNRCAFVTGLVAAFAASHVAAGAQKSGRAAHARNQIRAVLAVMAAVIGPVCITAAEAATFTVNSSSDASDANPGDGVCATSSNVCTLRAAIEEANALPGKDTINIPAGIYTLLSRIQIQDSVDLVGASTSTTIVTGGSRSPIFRVTASLGGIGPTVTFQRLTLRDGRNARFADSGVVLQNDRGATTRLSDSIVLDNASDIYGGAIDNRGKLQIIRSEIRNNSLPPGGGGQTSEGGGIFNTGELEIACSAVTENFATRGGGISNTDDGVVKIKNSTISSNRALGGGGGIRNVKNGRVYIASSTVTLNRGNEPNGDSEPYRTGGGIQTLSPATLFIGGTIVAGNTDNRTRFEADFSPDCFSDSSTTFITMRSNLFGVINNNCQLRDAISGSSTNFDLKGTETVPLDPRLDGLAGGIRIHALQVGSPAIDSNRTTATSIFFSCESVDQRGSPRPIDGDGDGQAWCDIGAYERQVSASAVDEPGCDRLQFELPSSPRAPSNLEIR